MTKQRPCLNFDPTGYYYGGEFKGTWGARSQIKLEFGWLWHAWRAEVSPAQ